MLYPSILFLKRRLSRRFNKAFCFWTAEGAEPVGDCLDVTLIGDACLHLTRVRYWPKTNFRLWTLAESNKRLLQEFYALRDDQVGTISRYSLVPIQTKFINWPDLSQGVTFIASARASRRKGWVSTFEFIAELQRRFPGKIDLEICGPGWVLPKKNLLHLNEWINKSSLEKPPINLGDKGFDWIPRDKKKRIFIQFSSDFFEDFGVSAAQAEAVGLPCLVTDHAGLAEMHTAIKIPLEVLGPFFEKPQKLKQQAIKAVDFFLRSYQPGRTRIKKIARTDSAKPTPISYDELKRITDRLKESEKKFLSTLHNRQRYPKKGAGGKLMKRIMKALAPVS